MGPMANAPSRAGRSERSIFRNGGANQVDISKNINTIEITAKIETFTMILVLKLALSNVYILIPPIFGFRDKINPEGIFGVLLKNIDKHMSIHLLPSRLYCRPWNFTKST